MKLTEMLWRKTAARNRFQMRQAALWWRESGEPSLLQAAILCRDLHRSALERAQWIAKGRTL